MPHQEKIIPPRSSFAPLKPTSMVRREEDVLRGQLAAWFALAGAASLVVGEEGGNGPSSRFELAFASRQTGKADSRQGSDGRTATRRSLATRKKVTASVETV